MADGGYGQDYDQQNQDFFQSSYAGYGFDGSENQQGTAEATGYDMGGGNEQFPQEQQFGQFDYNQAPPAASSGYDNAYMGAQQQGDYGPQAGYSGSIMTPDPIQAYSSEPSNSFDDEPPLMEELGINFNHIRQKTLAVLNPLATPDTSIMQDTDLAGPLVFCMAFGGTLLLTGKVHFGYIYGIGVVGCLAMYALLNLMSMMGVSASCIVSVLGYCLLPMVLLSGLSVVLSLQGVIGIISTAITVLWCSISASKLFVSALTMDSQQLLVAYPCALVYGVFALITVF